MTARIAAVLVVLVLCTLTAGAAMWRNQLEAKSRAFAEPADVYLSTDWKTICAADEPRPAGVHEAVMVPVSTRH